MRNGLIVKLSMAIVFVLSATTWAQEVQPSLSDNVAENLPPEPVMMDSSISASCGCNQMTMQPMMVQPAVAACNCCAPVKKLRRSSRCNCCVDSCGDCGMVAQVAYQEIMPASTPRSIVTTAPTPNFTQPTIINSGCCGNITNAPQSTYMTPVSTTYPATTITDPGYTPTTITQGVYTGSTCSTCSQPRRLFGRMFRRR